MSWKRAKENSIRGIGSRNEREKSKRVLNKGQWFPK
jgi:hypothetical protein